MALSISSHKTSLEVGTDPSMQPESISTIPRSWRFTTVSVLLDRAGNGYNRLRYDQYWRDTNGNYFSVFSNTGGVGWTDTLGRQLGASADDGSGTAGCSTASGLQPVSYAEMYSFPAPNGGHAYW